MRAAIHCENNVDTEGWPAGGSVEGVGLSISWQDGPVVDPEKSERRQPNGAFVEDVLAGALQRLQYYQDSLSRCRQNAIAITKIQEALFWLRDRKEERKARGVEGTHEV